MNNHSSALLNCNPAAADQLILIHRICLILLFLFGLSKQIVYIQRVM